MTTQEEVIFGKLSQIEQDLYYKIEEEHPNWSFNQIMVKVQMERKTDEVIEGGGKDIDPDDPTIYEGILKGVKSLLQGIGIVAASIFSALDRAITTVGDLIARGLKSIGHFLDDIFDEIFG